MGALTLSWFMNWLTRKRATNMNLVGRGEELAKILCRTACGEGHLKVVSGSVSGVFGGYLASVAVELDFTISLRLGQSYFKEQEIRKFMFSLKVVGGANMNRGAHTKKLCFSFPLQKKKKL